MCGFPQQQKINAALYTLYKKWLFPITATAMHVVLLTTYRSYCFCNCIPPDVWSFTIRVINFALNELLQSKSFEKIFKMKKINVAALK